MADDDELQSVEFGKIFDLCGEPAIIELFESVNLKTGEKYYVASLDMIGRVPRLTFSSSEVEKKKLDFVPI